MVDRGEVDPMLAPETAGECQKFGKVVDCKVYEVRLLFYIFIISD